MGENDCFNLRLYKKTITQAGTTRGYSWLEKWTFLYAELPDASARCFQQNKLIVHIEIVDSTGLIYEVDEKFGGIKKTSPRK